MKEDGGRERSMMGSRRRLAGIGRRMMERGSGLLEDLRVQWNGQGGRGGKEGKCWEVGGGQH
jgi:hypothetical protein